MSAAEKLDELVKALNFDGEMLEMIHQAGFTDRQHEILALAKAYLKIIGRASHVIEQYKAHGQPFEKLTELLRSHPEVVSVEVITASDLERMAANE